MTKRQKKLYSKTEIYNLHIIYSMKTYRVSRCVVIGKPREKEDGSVKVRICPRNSSQVKTRRLTVQRDPHRTEILSLRKGDEVFVEYNGEIRRIIHHSKIVRWVLFNLYKK